MININLDEVVHFIENTNKCKLYEYQKTLLNNIIHNEITDCPRGCGKSMVIKGYTDYLNYLINFKHDICKVTSGIADKYISGDSIMNELPNTIHLYRRDFFENPDRARRDYNVDYSSPYLIIDENAFKKGDK